jgi:hypothetical protein
LQQNIITINIDKIHLIPSLNVRREFMQRLSAALHGTWVPISAMLFRRAVLTLWHAFLFLGLRFFPSFLRLVASTDFSCKKL